ncbi:LacI family DNA-binding transcriptional regulator [Dactylosporangium sp. CA-233914]|uniref:LacI family DNA-binding transcriptional regulator n=1 Tax=Dactylosporangium sp. CA-233914 TaxID=3239934 RepID=UPI003D8C9CCE
MSAPHRKPPTLAMVAQRAGVSRATASRAYSEPHRLLAETVRRVMAAADEVGYRRATTPVVQQTKNLVLVVADTANPFFPPMIRAVERQADAAGYAVFLGNTDEDPAREERLLDRFTPQVDGMIIASSRMNENVILAYAKLRPIVLVNRDLSPLPRVLIDTVSGVSEAVAHLADLGHREITYLSGPIRSWSNGQRRDTVKRAGELRGMTVTVLSGRRSSYEVGRNSTEAVLASGSTAVIAFDDLLAHGLMTGLAERGVSVPQELSVIGCDDVLATQTHPRLTTVSARSAEAGATAADLLIGQLAGDVPHGECRQLLTTNLIPGATTAAPQDKPPRRRPGRPAGT